MPGRQVGQEINWKKEISEFKVSIQKDLVVAEVKGVVKTHQVSW